MGIESILALAAAVFVFSLKPGPGIMMSMARSVSDGLPGLITFLLGFNIGLGIYLAIVFIGFETINVDILFLSILLKSLAAIYLIYIGVKGLTNPKPAAPVVESETLFDSMTSAVMLTLSNPMIIVFYASVMQVFINPAELALDEKILIAAMLMAIDTFGMVIYCLPLLIFRQRIPESFMAKVQIVSSVIIILMGLYIGYTAVGAEDALSVF